MRNYLEFTLLDEVVADGAGSAKNVTQYEIITSQIIATDVTDGASVSIEASLNGTDFVAYETFAITEDGSHIYTISDAKVKFIRASVSSRTDGTYSVICMAG